MIKIPFVTIPIENDGFHIIIEVELLHRKFNMVIDTGASKTVLDKQTILNSGLTKDELQSSNILSTGLGTNEMQSHLLHLDYLRINNWEIKKIDIAVLDLSTINIAYTQMNLSPIVGVLGGDILVKYGAIINYKTNILQLNVKARK